ncbi:CCA tRNA nucleotidyltransferase [Chloroflexota bacterium]
MRFAEASLKNSLISLIEPKVSLLLAKVSSFLAELDIKAYVVGGVIRDALLERHTADIDIAVASDALEITPKVAAYLNGKYVMLDKVNRIGRVVLTDDGAPSTKAQWELDFSTLKGSIEQDLAQRDFTIDAMAINISQFGRDLRGVQLIDPFNGQDDLSQRMIRVVADTAFVSDAARLLRAVRLASELGFSIDKKTESLIRHHSSLIASVAGERVREELLQLLAVSDAGQSLSYLDELGLLTALFPELSKTKGANQPKEHFWDVFEHSFKTVTAVDFLLRQDAWEYVSKEVLASVPWSATLAHHFDQEVSSGSTRRLLLKLAALLHDIAKPQTKANIGGRIRFLGHDKEGAAIATNILERLRFSVKEVRLVEALVRHHLRPGQMSQDKLPSHRAIYRYFRDTGDAGIDILFLSLADHLATRGPNLILTHWQEHTQMMEYVLSQHFEKESIAHPPKLVDGHDLINIFGLKPGPKIGELLEAAREAQASGEITTREETLSFIDRLLTSPPPSKREAEHA